MKAKVIEFFQNLPEAKHDQFNKAFELYRQSEGKNPITERVFNAKGFTPSSLENLLYDLQKIHGITDVEKVRSEKLEVRSEEDEIFIALKSILEMDDKKLALWADKRQNSQGDVQSLLDYAISKENEEFILVLTKAWESLHIDLDEEGSLKVISEELDSLKEENEDLQAEKEELEFENLDLKEEIETLKLAPKLDAQAIRVEFPFLNEKDCPDELKILMADKITAWNRYLGIQEYLQKIETGEVQEPAEHIAELAKEAIEYFDENQKIYDELNCYQTTGKVLGVHPIFKKLQLSREVETMTADELIKYRGSSAKFASVKKTALAKAKKAKDTAKVQEIEAAVAERSEKLFLVNKKLGV